MVTERYHRVVASFDLIVVGAGIVGPAHALAASRRGLKVAVVERDTRAMSASVRNFGFVTVTGQADGDTRRRALRSREVWVEVAAERSEEHTSELQSPDHLVCRLLLEKKKNNNIKETRRC